MPHDHHHVLATYHKAGEKEVQMAIDAAMKAHKEWSELPWVERASIMLRVAELLATKYRYILNASVMLGQSKNPFQAEIDAPCELIDFLRFSTFYASQVYADQPYSETGILNRMEYRALEGFVFSLTPFNFTSIASNLNMAPAMMGNVAVWKPSTTAIHSNYFLMKVFQEAGLPDGVVNFIPGQGSVIGKVITGSRDWQDSILQALPLRSIPYGVRSERTWGIINLIQNRRRDRWQELYLRSSFRSGVGCGYRYRTRCVRVSRAEVLGGFSGLYPGFSLERGERLRGRYAERDQDG